MPELPEAERARQQIERALGREIVAVDDRDTYVCRPHAPGEIADALVGRRLTAAHRRGKFLWAETDGGPDLGLHLGMAGRFMDEMPGMSFGHAGTIVEGKEDTATEKIARLGAAGIVVAERIEDIPELVKQGIAERKGAAV